MSGDGAFRRTRCIDVVLKRYSMVSWTVYISKENAASFLYIFFQSVLEDTLCNEVSDSRW